MHYNVSNTPVEVYRAVCDIIEDGDFECADTFRYAPADDAEAVAEYESIRNSGCCGSHDTEVKDNTGRVWKVGFNYGH